MEEAAQQRRAAGRMVVRAERRCKFMTHTRTKVQGVTERVTRAHCTDLRRTSPSAGFQKKRSRLTRPAAYPLTTPYSQRLLRPRPPRHPAPCSRGLARSLCAPSRPDGPVSCRRRGGYLTPRSSVCSSRTLRMRGGCAWGPAILSSSSSSSSGTRATPPLSATRSRLGVRS